MTRLFSKNAKKPEPENSAKKYHIRVEIYENDRVVYTKVTPNATADSRLKGVQMLAESYNSIWQNIMSTFHFIDTMRGSKEAGSEEASDKTS